MATGLESSEGSLTEQDGGWLLGLGLQQLGLGHLFFQVVCPAWWLRTPGRERQVEMVLPYTCEPWTWSSIPPTALLQLGRS